MKKKSMGNADGLCKKQAIIYKEEYRLPCRGDWIRTSDLAPPRRVL